LREYVFRHHLETSVDEKKELKDVTFRNIKSLPYFENSIKVRINHIGQIIKVLIDKNPINNVYGESPKGDDPIFTTSAKIAHCRDKK
jgi:hypothetical protein